MCCYSRQQQAATRKRATLAHVVVKTMSPSLFLNSVSPPASLSARAAASRAESHHDVHCLALVEGHSDATVGRYPAGGR